MKLNIFRLSYFTLALFCVACQDEGVKKGAIPNFNDNCDYTPLTSITTGIDFINALDLNQLMSPLEYINVYNGGGVAIGDLNNDGLSDIYFTGNLSDNKLYLNKGNLSFEDITSKTDLACADSWCTGATIFDVNGDGLQDIYVCRSYYSDPARRENLLYINLGNLEFEERAKDFGLNDNGYSIMASFLDYDRDGLADLFVGNHPKERIVSYQKHYDNWLNPALESSNHLYKNTGANKFKDYTRQSGLLAYGWTLGMVCVDLNQDDWTDIYVTVDHTEPDRFYINNKDGTFTDATNKSLKHMSQSTMGVDAGDVNNDGLLDLITVEMLSEDYLRSKTQMQNMDVGRFWDFVKKGHNYQYMRNMLHVNNGNETFRELGQMANIDKTDWSWASLFIDYNNDGLEDLFISNGYYKDYADNDYRIAYNEKLDNAFEKGMGQLESQLFKAHSKDANSTQLENYLFENQGAFNFKDVSSASNLNFKGFSNGAAYGDLDNDGDLDLVVNNIDDHAIVFQNNCTEQSENNWLRVKLIRSNNGLTIGSKLTLSTPNKSLYKEHTRTRGYQSSVEDFIHFGIGAESMINSLTVKWPDGKIQILENIKPNQLLEVQYNKSKLSHDNQKKNDQLFSLSNLGLNFNHREKYFNDYDKQVLLPHQMSCFGPANAIGDINGDGLEDFFIGGAQEQSGALFVQLANGKFEKHNSDFLEATKNKEDVAAAFFDMDNDGDNDLYVASGGNEYEKHNAYYSDRLYINQGNGNFKSANHLLPKNHSSSSCVKPYDYDGDGDLDLFVGSRHLPWEYPFPGNSYILKNTKDGFVDVSSADIKKIGMVTDAIWTDLNEDGKVDLMIVGEWMPLSFLIFEDGEFVNKTKEFGLAETTGWWNRITKADFDGDGNDDYAIGNLGLNYKYRISDSKSFHIYADDFDDNNSSDIVLSYQKESKSFPVRGKQCSSEQIPELSKKFPSYKSFAMASLEDIYGENLEKALHYQIDIFESSFLWNNGDGSYTLKAMPREAQSAPTNGLVVDDFNKDGKLDLLIAGNMHNSEVETGRADAGIGCLMTNKGNRTFNTDFYPSTGFFANGDVKDLKLIARENNADVILLVRNNGDLSTFTYE